MIAALAGGLLALGLVGPAQAASNFGNSFMAYEQTFFLYVESDELPRFTFTQAVSTSTPSNFTITDPTGTVQKTCTIPPRSPVTTTTCTSEGLTSTTSGIWSIRFDPNTPTPTTRWFWTVDVVDAASSVIPGRVWVEEFNQYQVNAANETFWVASREGYVYRMDFRGYSGQGSFLRANGFGLVEAGTCIPIYKSVQGSISGANGSVVDPRYEFSDACGDDYKMFLEEPATDLPAAAAIAGGTQWIRPAVVPPSATDLTLQQEGPFSRAGEIQFDLAGVNGGYTVQLDTNANGVYTDPVDRTIPWGSPPGAVSVPFDGLDGLGNPLSVCAPMSAKVVVDRVGETHVVLDDVESLGTSSVNNYGIRVTGATPGVVGPNPRLYWDDRDLVGGGAPLPYADGRAGVDTTTTITGAHGWGQWGDQRSIENWTYYVAQAGAEVTIPDACDAALVLTKDGDLDDTNANGAADVGETIDYTFTVTNAGNAPVTDVTVQDDRVTGITPATATIPVFGERVFTADPYTVTQADVDAGGVPNEASAAGVDPLGEDVISNDATDFVATVERAPELELDKIATLGDTNGNGLADAGETIAYTFEVTNTGNVTVDGVAIVDPNVAGVSPAAVDLAPGASQTFTATTYAVTQADLNVGSVDNTAVAVGVSPTGDVQSNTDSATTPTPVPNPQLLLDKTAAITIDVDGDGRADVGDTITYTFEVRNTGNLDVTGVTIADPRIQATTPAAQDVPAGLVRTFTATYVATQADVDFGSIPNTATANGSYAGVDGATPIASAPDTAIVPTPDQAPTLTFAKDGTLDDANGNGVADVGETIDYTFTVTNTGNVTMANVTVFDDRVSTVTPASVTLAPTGAQTFTASDYVVTQADVDSGEILNVAYARGNIPGGAEIFTDTDDHVEDAVTATPGLTIDKIATLLDANDNGTADAGEEIAYAFLVTNTGNVTLTDVAVDDDMVAALLPDPIDFLPPASSYTFEAAPYTVTDADVDAGSIVNTASAIAIDPVGGTVVSGDDTETVLATASALLTLEKSATISDDVDGDERADVGDVITYTFEVENLGNLDLSDVTIDDPRIDAITPAAHDVPVGESRIFTATYTTTQADVDFGSVPNTATANGTYAGVDGPVAVASDPASAVVPTPDWEPELTLDKAGELDDANDNGVADAGETIVYTFTVENSGNVTLTNAAVSEVSFSGAGDLSDITCPAEAASVAPTASVTCTATYTVVAADLVDDHLTNTAIATGTSPAGDTVESAASTAIVAAGAPVTPAPSGPPAPSAPAPSTPPASGGADAPLPQTGTDADMLLPVAMLALLLLGVGIASSIRNRARRQH